MKRFPKRTLMACGIFLVMTILLFSCSEITKPNGEGDSSTGMSVKKGDVFPVLPTPEKEGFSFCGYTQNNAETDVEIPLLSSGELVPNFIADNMQTDGLTFALKGGEMIVTGCKSGVSSAEIIIPARAVAEDGTVLPVTKIGDGAFRNRKITKLVLPASLTEIGAYAFEGATLPHVFLPTRLAKIGERAFARTEGFCYFDLNKNLEAVAADAFCEAKITGFRSLSATFYTEDGVLFRDKTLFSYPAGAAPRNYIVPEFVTAIGDYAFFKQSFGKLEFGEKVKEIGAHSLEYASSATLILKGVETVGEDAMRGYIARVVNFPATLRQLSASSIDGICAKRIVFSGLPMLRNAGEPTANVYAPTEYLATFQKVFPRTAVLDKILLTGTQAVVYRETVIDCPDGVTAATIKADVKVIAAHAMDGDTLKTVRFEGAPPKMEKNAFLVGAALTLFVPERYLQEYKKVFSVYSAVIYSYSDGGENPVPPEPEVQTLTLVLDGVASFFPLSQGAPFRLPQAEKVGFDFLGWETGGALVEAGKEVTVIDDVTYTAVFRAKTFAVTFLSDGRILSTESVSYGGAATAPSDPTKPSDAEFDYIFAGWDKAFDKITENLTVNAAFEKTKRSYTVTFLADGEAMKTESVFYGGAATAPSDPTKPSDAEFDYIFAGWDKAFDKITENLTVNAAFEKTKRSYTVTFLADGEAMKTESVFYGGAATAPSDPTKPSDAEFDYVFAGWDKAFDKITENLTVNATFEKTQRNYTVTVWADGTIVISKMVLYGETFVIPVTIDGKTVAYARDENGETLGTSVLVTKNLEIFCEFEKEEDDPYAYTDGLYFDYNAEEDGYVVNYYVGEEKNVVIPKRFIGDAGDLEVIGITRSTFEGFAFSSLSLPDTLRYIDAFAFFNATGLARIELPAALVRLGVNAFYATGAEVIVTGDALTTIEGYQDEPLTLSVSEGLYTLYLERFGDRADVVIQKTVNKNPLKRSMRIKNFSTQKAKRENRAGL